jgi:hypothetical protein
MITIGVDVHTHVHAAVAVDAAGVILGEWRGATTAADWQALLAWAGALRAPRQWGSAGAWNYGRGLAQFLVAQGETVYPINPRWTADRRRA